MALPVKFSTELHIPTAAAPALGAGTAAVLAELGGDFSSEDAAALVAAVAQQSPQASDPSTKILL